MDDFALGHAEQALFRALVARRVRFMIIGLGAALVEGAAVATQDIDIWFEHAMDPEVANAARDAGGFFVSGLEFSRQHSAAKASNGSTLS